MKISYHLKIDEDDLIFLRHKAVDEKVSVHTLIINTLNEKYKFDKKKEKTFVRKKRKRKKSISE